jgi:hypothetical protein
LWAVTLAAVTKICVKPPVAEVLRSIMKPVSLVALSLQVRLMLPLETAVAMRPEGAAGAATVAGVVALAVFEYAESPEALVARI